MLLIRAVVMLMKEYLIGSLFIQRVNDFSDLELP
jgi:hypothetical protein